MRLDVELIIDRKKTQCLNTANCNVSVPIWKIDPDNQGKA